MLMTMRSQIEAQRALAFYTAAALDRASRHPVASEAARNQALVNFLIPIVKGWNTEQANELTSLAVQVHGGMGFIEETGVAQYYRDARITAIYEGTTGIQALDLIGRKTFSEGGATPVRCWMRRAPPPTSWPPPVTPAWRAICSRLLPRPSAALPSSWAALAHSRSWQLPVRCLSSS
jgi:hypothetical protein